MNKLVFFIWIALTSAITISISFCIFQPFWYIHDNHIFSFGLTVFCEGVPGNEHNYKKMTSQCQPYGGLFSLTNIPSGAWQASFLLFFTGAFSFGVTVILGILIHCVRQKYVYNVNSLVVYLQTSAGKLIRYSRACGSYQDFLDRRLLLTRKLLNQGFLLLRLKSSLGKFYGRPHDLVDRYGISVSQTTTDMFHLS
jgi:hypothetical protein